MNLADGFYQQAILHPDRLAFVLSDQALTYSQLVDEVALWQQHLLLLAAQQEVKGQLPASQLPASQLPVNEAPRVAWCGANDMILPALYIACVRLGYVLVLLDPDWIERTRTLMVQQIKPLAVLTPASRPALAKQALPRDVAEYGFRGHVDDLIEKPFLIGFTSGSSGRPKAFIRSQRSWLATFNQATVEFGSLDDLKVLAPGPLSHGLSFYAMAETLNGGGTFISQLRFDARGCVSLLRKQLIHSLVAVPTILAAIHDKAKTNSLSSPSRIVSAGAKLSPTLHSKLNTVFPKTEISEYYGASELSFVSVSVASELPPVESVGRAFRGVDLTVRGESGEVLPPGSIGLVCVKSDMLAVGYLGEDGQLQPLDVVGGYCTVGDLGRLDAKGFLYLVDRLNNQLITGGLNVYPGDIEKVLDQYPGVFESMVVGVEDEYWGDKLCAIVRSDQAQELKIVFATMKEYCRQHLSPHQIPRAFYQIEQWPLTTSGKLCRTTVVKWVATNDERLRALS